MYAPTADGRRLSSLHVNLAIGEKGNGHGSWGTVTDQLLDASHGGGVHLFLFCWSEWGRERKQCFNTVIVQACVGKLSHNLCELPGSA